MIRSAKKQFLSVLAVIITISSIVTGCSEDNDKTDMVFLYSALNYVPVCSESDNVKEDMTCQEYTIPVKLTTDSTSTFNVVGSLCYNGEPQGKTLNVLLSGGGYGPVYWDFPCDPETYSFVWAAVDAGYAVFNLSRIGIGNSDHPPSDQIDIEANGYVVNQAITFLNENPEAGFAFEKVVTIGHSLGSLIAIEHATSFPSDVDGVILTGFLHNKNPDYRDLITSTSYEANLDPRFTGRGYDNFYFTSLPGTRQIVYYHMDGVDPAVVATDEATKETLTLTEIISMNYYFTENVTIQITVPVLQVVGEYDVVVCGGALNCSDEGAVISNEVSWFSEDSCNEVEMIGNTDHVLNLHPTAPVTYQHMIDWADRRIGRNTDVAPTDPCP